MSQLLDRKDVNPDKPDNKGRIPLSWAEINGHELVTKCLLDQQDVNPAVPDKNWHIPLHNASSKGYEVVVCLLRSLGPPTPHPLTPGLLPASLSPSPPKPQLSVPHSRLPSPFQTWMAKRRYTASDERWNETKRQATHKENDRTLRGKAKIFSLTTISRSRSTTTTSITN